MIVGVVVEDDNEVDSWRDGIGKEDGLFEYAAVVAAAVVNGNVDGEGTEDDVTVVLRRLCGEGSFEGAGIFVGDADNDVEVDGKVDAAAGGCSWEEVELVLTMEFNCSAAHFDAIISPLSEHSLKAIRNTERSCCGDIGDV